MRQDEINRDLGSYLHDKKSKPFWKKSTLKIKPHHEFDDEVIVRHEIERSEVHNDGKDSSQVHHEGHGIAHHEPTVHHVQNIVHETRPAYDAKIAGPSAHKNSRIFSIDDEDEDLEKTRIKVEDAVQSPEKSNPFKKFFQKLSFSKDNDDDEPRQIGHMEMSNNPDITMDDEELRELLHGLHNWIIQLPSDKLERFKTSKEFELYTKYLRKHNLIK